MKGYNHVTLMGNLTRDPELKHTNGGTAYLRFTLAVGYSKKQQDGSYKDETDFPTCIAWGKRAEAIAKYLAKGSGLLVDGKLRTGSYEDKNGTKHYTVDVHVEDFNFAGEKQKNSGGGYQAQAPQHGQGQDDYGDFSFQDGPGINGEADIPF